jgi:hypothetical protein
MGYRRGTGELMPCPAEAFIVQADPGCTATGLGVVVLEAEAL